VRAGAGSAVGASVAAVAPQRADETRRRARREWRL